MWDWNEGAGNFKTYQSQNSDLTIDSNGAADIFSNRPDGTAYLDSRGFLKFWKETTSISTYSNSKATACFMDTKIWNGFASGLPEGIEGNCYAIGGPTVSMWIESWNALYSTEKLYYNKTDELGYWVNDGQEINSLNQGYIMDWVMKKKAGYENNLFFPRHQSISSCWAYYLSTPSHKTEYSVFLVTFFGGLRISTE